MKKYLSSILLAGSLLASAIAVAQTAVVPSVNSLDNKPATYSAVTTGVTVASSATDIFRLSGSATKTIYVKRIAVSGVKTTSGALTLALYKRSTANADGTTVAITEHPLDSGAATATAVATSITANQTVGTGVLIGAKRTAWLSDTAAVQPPVTEWNWGGFSPEGYLVLRGVAQGLAVNLLGTTQTGGVATVEVEWMEK